MAELLTKGYKKKKKIEQRDHQKSRTLFPPKRSAAFSRHFLLSAVANVARFAPRWARLIDRSFGTNFIAFGKAKLSPVEVPF